jgi:hypothetical protein
MFKILLLQGANGNYQQAREKGDSLEISSTNIEGEAITPRANEHHRVIAWREIQPAPVEPGGRSGAPNDPQVQAQFSSKHLLPLRRRRFRSEPPTAQWRGCTSARSSAPGLVRDDR